MPGLLDGDNYKAIRQKYEAIMYYMREFYFKALVRGGHNILYTIPMWDKSTHDNRDDILTALKFQIYPFTAGSNKVFQGLFGSYQKVYDRNSIVFLGMSGHRPLPQGYLPRGLNFVGGSSQSISEGTITLSRSSFLDSCLLRSLSIINRGTTVRASFSGVNGNGWTLNLTTGIKDESKNSYKWKNGTPLSDSLRFEWEDNGHREHEDKGDRNRKYSINCESTCYMCFHSLLTFQTVTTHNTLLIPTVQQTGSLAISVKGEVKIKLRCEGSSMDWR